MNELLERFFSHVDMTDTCWLWTGSTSKGYGRFGSDHHTYQAHRWLWVYLGLEIGPDEDLDHLCRVRRCVNPTHLEPVSRRENLLRGETIVRRALQTHCIHGHRFDSANTHIRKNGTRACRRCHRDREYSRRHVGPS